MAIDRDYPEKKEIQSNEWIKGYDKRKKDK
jgi:hypothetical protein